jgi:hypothetical protein
VPISKVLPNNTITKRSLIGKPIINFYAITQQ